MRWLPSKRVWQVQHLADSSSWLWVLQWLSCLPLGLSIGSWGMTGAHSLLEEYSWRSVRSKCPQVPFTIAILLACASHFHRWGRQTASALASCFCIAPVLLMSLFLFIFYFSFPVIYWNNFFQRGQLCLPATLVAQIASPNGRGSSCHLQNVLYTLLFVCVVFLVPLLGCLLSFLPCFLHASSLAKRINIAIRTSVTWLAELNTRCREARVSKWAISWACSPVKLSSRWKAVGFQGVILPLVLWSCV